MFAGTIQHRGKTIVFLDISGCRSVAESIQTGNLAKAIILAQPAKSVRMLTDVTGAHYDKQAAEYMKRFSQDITPYVKASAMVGMSSIRQLIANAMMYVSGRHIRLFDSLDTAKDWLAQQD